MKVTRMELIAIAFMVLAIIKLCTGGKQMLELIILAHLCLIQDRLDSLK